MSSYVRVGGAQCVFLIEVLRCSFRTVGSNLDQQDDQAKSKMRLTKAWSLEAPHSQDLEGRRFYTCSYISWGLHRSRANNTPSSPASVSRFKTAQWTGRNSCPHKQGLYLSGCQKNTCAVSLILLRARPRPINWLSRCATRWVTSILVEWLGQYLPSHILAHDPPRNKFLQQKKVEKNKTRLEMMDKLTGPRNQWSGCSKTGSPRAGGVILPPREETVKVCLRVSVLMLAPENFLSNSKFAL